MGNELEHAKKKKSWFEMAGEERMSLCISNSCNVAAWGLTNGSVNSDSNLFSWMILKEIGF